MKEIPNSSALKRNCFCLSLILLCVCVKATITLQLSGKISAGTANYLYLSRTNYWIFLPEKFDSIAINQDGTFSKTLSLTNEPLFLYNGNNNLGLVFPQENKNKKDSLYLSIDLVKNNIVVDAVHQPLYTFFARYQDKFRVNNGFGNDYRRNLALPGKDFIQTITEEYRQRNRLLDSFELKNPYAVCFVRFIKKTNYYECYSKGYDYLMYHQYYLNKKFVYFPQDSLFTDFFRGLTLHKDDIQVPELGYMINYIVDNAYDSTLTADKTDTDKLNSSTFKFNYARTRFRNSTKMRDMALCSVIKDVVDKGKTENDFKKADSLVSVMELISDNHLYTQFARDYYRTKAPFNSTLDFKLKDDKGTTLTLSSIKDKTVVIFFWGTWCGPCNKQFESYKSLTEQYSAKIQFIDVALEVNTYESWKKSVLKNFSAKGNHLYAEGGYNSKDLSQFNLSSVPRIVIIKNQEVLNFNGPMPNDNLLDELKKYN